MSATDLRDLIHEAEWRKCRGSGPDDFAACKYFLETYWHIKHPERGAILLDLRDAQKSTLEDWIGHRLSIVLKARQIGFSTLVMGLAFWICFFHDDKFVIGLSRTERDAHKLLDKAVYGYERLPQWMRDRGPKRTAKAKGVLPFSNGSSIESLPASDPARGESAYLIVVDEWAFFPDAEAAWAAIEPATDIGGRVIALSTANGSGNLYHRMVVGAMTGSNRFKFIFHSWRAVPERDDSWYEAKKLTMESWQLHQEYPTTPEEAFIKSGNVVFDVDRLQAIECQPPRLRGRLHPSGQRGAQFLPYEDGELQVWEQPKVGHRYTVGADVAEGLDHGDWSVAWVLDAKTNQAVAKWRGRVEPDDFGDVLYRLGWWYNAALIGVEVNSIGLVTVLKLRDLQYPNIYRRTSYDERSMKPSKKLGWRTQVNTKPKAVMDLSAALREDLWLVDEETIGELRTFVREQVGESTVKYHGSPHDDQVMALAIAVQMLQHTFVPQEAADSPSAWMTAQGVLDEVIDAARREEAGRMVLGRFNTRR